MKDGRCINKLRMYLLFCLQEGVRLINTNATTINVSTQMLLVTEEMTALTALMSEVVVRHCTAVVVIEISLKM